MQSYELFAASLARTSPVVAPKMQPLFAIVNLLLDGVLALTWSLTERPRKIRWHERIDVVAPDRFKCVACGQVWSIPSRLRSAFAFRCECGERMIVHRRNPGLR
jgi:hypothetical protein